MKPNSSIDFKIFFVFIAVLAVPALITLSTIDVSQNKIVPVENSSPLGYTWSLSLFIVPILAIVAWLHLRHKKIIIQKAFWISLLFLIPLGFILDLFFGLSFFTFKNQGAVLGIYLPGLDIAQWKWLPELPIEEFVFYVTGFIAVLSIYLWCDEYWLAAYNIPDYYQESKSVDKLVLFHPQSIVIGILLVIAATLYKNLVPGPDQGGFPGYFAFLVAASFIPSAAFFRSTQRFINWRAFSSTFFFVLLISLIWEATLAAPYQWWGYNDRQMIGITVDAWVGLPVEAVLVWMAVTFTTVIGYETIKIILHKDTALKHALFGKQ
ncbi:hypothetical protein [Methylomarinum vadi]|uniref:hypothetical protein n=1 Tax=Methylomarinum vadi TaxID=438855 RepID=UPI00068CBF63|nr:hypothetical protein [Methylomarinum vadi]